MTVAAALQDVTGFRQIIMLERVSSNWTTAMDVPDKENIYGAEYSCLQQVYDYSLTKGSFG